MRKNMPKEYIHDEPADVWNENGTPKVRVKIDGLTQIGEGTFELSGVKPRNADWNAAMSALGFETIDGSVVELVDRLADVVWDHDIREILAERIKRA